MCYTYDNVRDLMRVCYGFTWFTYVTSAVSGVAVGLTFGQAGLVGLTMWNKQVLDTKFRMLDGSKVFIGEVDAYKTVTDEILNHSAARYNGWRTSFFHHGPYLLLSLLIAENFGLFDRN